MTARILYVTKMPPSPSGIALYASVFESVLRTLGPVELASVPGDPRATQSLRASAGGLVSGFRTGAEYDLVHAELGGRGLVELYLTVGVLLRPESSRPVVAVTCHDVPSLVGESGLFRCLDRRGLRRAARGLTRFLGRRAERLVMERADVVLTLTEAGARRVEGTYGRPAVAVPHVVDDPPPAPKEPVVLLPGHVSDPASVVAVAEEVAAGPATPAGSWTVVVGSSSADVRREATAVADRTGMAISFTGHVAEGRFLDNFLSAAVVVRVHQGASSSNNLAASGPLNWACARGCVVVTDDDRAGAVELARDGLVTRAPSVVAPLRDVLAAWDETLADGETTRRRTQERAGVATVSETYGKAVGPALSRHLSSGGRGQGRE